MNNPCELCGASKHCFRDKGGQPVTHLIWESCGPYAKYLGYQEGLAECEARIHKREQEIVKWIARIV